MGEITLRDTLQQQPVLVKNLDQGFFKQTLKLEMIRGLKIPFEILVAQEWNLSARILLLKWKSSHLSLCTSSTRCFLFSPFHFWRFDEAAFASVCISISLKCQNQLWKQWLVCMGLNSWEIWYISFSFEGVVGGNLPVTGTEAHGQSTPGATKYI